MAPVLLVDLSTKGYNHASYPESQMTLEAMLLLALPIFLFLCFLLFLVITYVESSKAEYPPGIANPKELRIIHTFSTGLNILGQALQRLGICSEVAPSRFMFKLNKWNLKNDPELIIKNLQFDGVPVRLYQPRTSTSEDRKGVVFFHGGGFVIGCIESYERFCRYMAKKSEAVVVSVGYRLAPEHHCPAAFEDCLKATIHFLKTAKQYSVNPSSVIICGDSAGGNLAAAISQVLVTRADIPKPLAQAMIYPSVQMIDRNLPSYQQNSLVPLLLSERTRFHNLTYLGVNVSRAEFFSGIFIPPELRSKVSKWLGSDNIPDEFKVRDFEPHVISGFNNEVYQKLKSAFDTSCSPLLAEDTVVCLLPKTYILTCEFDVLRDDGLLYKKRLEDNGVPVSWYHVKDGFHGIVNLFDRPTFKSAKRAMDNFVNFIEHA